MQPKMKRANLDKTNWSCNLSIEGSFSFSALVWGSMRLYSDGIMSKLKKVAMVKFLLLV